MKCDEWGFDERCLNWMFGDLWLVSCVWVVVGLGGI